MATRAISNLTLLVALSLLMGCLPQLGNQSADKEPSAPPKLEGTWQGTLGEGRGKLRLVVSISKSNDGRYSGIIDSIDQNVSFPIDSIAFSAGRTSPSLRFSVIKVQGVYEGTLAKDGSHFVGNWTQHGVTRRLDFSRGR